MANKYSIKDGLVCRDIKGIYFVIDIYDKHFYRNKQIQSVNLTAYNMVSLMIEKGEFTDEEIADEMIELYKIDDEKLIKKIKSDVESFIEILKSKGWVEND